MNFVKLNFITSQNQPFSYNGYYLPRVGDNINWPGEFIVGVVTGITWIHSNEVNVSWSPVSNVG